MTSTIYIGLFIAHTLSGEVTENGDGAADNNNDGDKAAIYTVQPRDKANKSPKKSKSSDQVQKSLHQCNS